jgi:hypothetical protein
MENGKINWDLNIIQNDPLAKCILLSLLANYIIKVNSDSNSNSNSDSDSSSIIMVSRQFPFIFENSERYQNTINNVISFLQSHSFLHIKIFNQSFVVYSL